MNLIDIAVPVLMTTFPFVLISLLFFGLRAIYSHWLKDIEYPDVHNYRKGNTEYKEPPRPHSKSFSDLVELAIMSTPHRQRQLARTFSQLLNETLNHDLFTENLMSESLKSLIDNPDRWLDQMYDEISRSSELKKKFTSEILHNHFIQLLKEIKELIQIPLLPESD
ncbi:hypothetical protein [Candidatus Hodarchaeum mangrovi]